ncbi:pentatricopeptide repeat-containing protein At3g62890-like [Magnolia sinica]|uniref:pentatricopeptide repeat-containing protein At3g62890-like n=1 Tax=Magnolia sinica TaxID=86752 RepID=UPI002659F250|nr:pentatricopeptide repeat-containing protein At3g62890-like [Magnolia sinica]
MALLALPLHQGPPNHSSHPHPPFLLLTTPLQSCTSIKQAKQIHASILRNSGLLHHHQRQELFVWLISALHGNHSSYAALVFEQQLQEDATTIFMWNTMIRSHASSSSDPMHSFSLYNRMRENGILPNNYTFTFLINASATTPMMLRLGPAIHAQTIVFGIPNSDVHIHTALLHMYAAGGNIENARSVFDRMLHKTTATWNAMIAGYTKRGDVESAWNLFDAMPDRDEQSWNVMVCGYARIGECDVAGMLFEGMPVKTLPTWNAMIAGYAQDSRPADALEVFRQMQFAGVTPDKITMVAVLPACTQLGALELGEWLHVYADKNRLSSNNAVCNALMDMYAKCGSIDKAMAVFKGMKERTVVSWNTMISGMAIHGRAKEAIELFAEMESEGVVPDDITFVGLLSACGHAGFVDSAWAYFRRMLEVYQIQPKIEHYGCMVDVLGRAQLLGEALELIDNMPIEPNSVILGSLLSACRSCNDFQLGEMVLEKLVDLEPLNPGYYVLLSNMYACSGRWREVIRVRNLMKLRGIEKTPGCSSIEVDSTVHEFIVGDKTHPQTQEIYAKLEEISERLHLVGYMPDTSVVLFDLDEEEKAQNLSVHSEKLAVAFGLLKTSAGKPIRVVKNLRVCCDCHTALKLISNVYERDIIVRDRNRFHHFKDGICSCNEYW